LPVWRSAKRIPFAGLCCCLRQHLPQKNSVMAFCEAYSLRRVMLLPPATSSTKKQRDLHHAVSIIMSTIPYFNSNVSINFVVKFPSRKSLFCISC
jgi:hypothetical protein